MSDTRKIEDTLRIPGAPLANIDRMTQVLLTKADEVNKGMRMNDTLIVGGKPLELRALKKDEVTIFVNDLVDTLGGVDSSVRKLFIDRLPALMASVGYACKRWGQTFQGIRATGSAIGWTLPKLRGVYWGDNSKCVPADPVDAFTNDFGTDTDGTGLGAGSGMEHNFGACTQGAWIRWVATSTTVGLILDADRRELMQIIIGVMNPSTNPSIDEILIYNENKEEIPYDISMLQISDSGNQTPVVGIPTTILLPGESFYIMAHLCDTQTDDRTQFLGATIGKASRIQTRVSLAVV